MIQPNLPIPLAFHYLSFSHLALSLLLSLCPLATITSFISSLSSSLLCYLCIPLPCSFPRSIFVSPSLAVSVFISVLLHILVFIAPYLSDTDRGEGRGLGNGEHGVLIPHIVIAPDTMRENFAHIPLPLTEIIQT